MLRNLPMWQARSRAMLTHLRYSGVKAQTLAPRVTDTIIQAPVRQAFTPQHPMSPVSARALLQQRSPSKDILMPPLRLYKALRNKVARYTWPM